MRAVVVCLVLGLAAPASAQGRLTALVNPFIGTGGHGHTYPGPSLPFGMIQPGPDTRLTGWDGCSGYHYSDSRIFGFSHTHLSGTGIPDYTDVLLMPTTGPVRLNNGADGRPGYASAFSHADEIATPGYYAVTLQDYGVRAELTTSLRVGMHRYTFPKGAPAHVILDLAHRDELKSASIAIVNDREVAGVRRSTGWAKDQVVYFVISFSSPFTTSGGEDPGDVRGAPKRAFHFGSNGGTLLVKVGISAVSVEGARKNMDAEAPGWNFEGLRRAAASAWEQELSKIRVEGGTGEQRTIFYTALYHAMLAPNVYMDVDGQYRGRDLQVHTAEGFTYYSVFSLWDTFRALHPLLTIIDRARTRDFIRTFLRQFQEGGRLPVWELAANETDTMIGYHAVPVIADAIAKGIDGFDLELAFKAMTRSADEDRFGLAAYKRDGFIDAREEAEGVSRTLEYAYDDWTIAQVARKLGRHDDHARYIRRSQSWKHLFDPSTGFMRARVEGFWLSPFEPAEVNNHYTEANAWQYSFFVPHDVEGLMTLMGGADAFARKLDALFSADSRTTGREQADITGLIGQYAHGNEPSHHMAYLYAYAGQPWKTQALVRRIMDSMYKNSPDGLSGNEDCGQMSAWYVLSALGFYPVAPGSTEYAIGSPLFDVARIRLENRRTFVVRAPGAAVSPYVHRARVNGSVHRSPFFDHGVILAGGELSLEMKGEPNRTSGLSSAIPVQTAVQDAAVLALPFVATGSRMFRDHQQVTLGAADKGIEIRYTVDGSDPSMTSPRYERPIAISDSLTLKAVAVRGGSSSPLMSVSFRRLPAFPKISLSGNYAPQYAAAGDDTLIDGLRGNDSFKTGRWQGYQGTNLEATLDFGSVRDIRQVAMGFLQDTGSWIFMPRLVLVEASDDGRDFRALGSMQGDVSERESKAVTRDFILEIPQPTPARYLRLRVERYGKLPDWHAGAGNESWFFADEIIVR